MNSRNIKIWQIWADRLKQWGLQDYAASALEASDPINLVGAQLVYISQPLLGGIFPTTHLNALASLLEEPEETQAFISLLREAAV